jgi:hypothetical protein
MSPLYDLFLEPSNENTSMISKPKSGGPFVARVGADFRETKILGFVS